MFCILAFPLGGFIRNMNILLVDILLVFIIYISLYKGVPPHHAPPARAVDQCHERILSSDKIFQAFLILEGILELWLGKKSFVLEMASCWQIFLV